MPSGARTKIGDYHASKAPESFAGVEVVAKANVYFDGKVVSHTVRFQDGSKKTLG